MRFPLQLVGVLFLLKVGYLLFSISVAAVSGLHQKYQFKVESYAEIGMRKDGYWYKKIAEEGYPKGEEQAAGGRLLDFSEGQSAWAFFPAYPVFNRWLNELAGISYENAAFITSLLFSVAAILGFFLFCKAYWQDEQKAFFSTLVLFAFPFSFYYSMFLTEAPFFAFLIWSFYAIQRKQYLALSILLIPLVLLRPNGLILLLPVFLFILEKEQIPIVRFVSLQKGMIYLLYFVPTLLFFSGYCYYQKQMTGYYFAFSQAQQGWGKTFMFPLFALFRKGDFNYQFTSVYAVLIIIMLLFAWRKLPLSFNIMILISLCLPLTAGSTYGLIRYMSVVFPIFLLIADWLYPLGRKWLLISGLYLLQLASFYLWLADFPLGY